jgi:superfamily II DNA or RNA helicase
VSQILPLRDYQKRAIEAVEADWAAGARRPAVVLPTGAGKTVVFAHMAARWRAKNRSRVLVLAHREELIEQAADKLRMIAPHLSVGIIKGPRHEVGVDVIVASVQSLRSETRRHRVYDVGLIVVDECHHGTAPTYRAILAHFGALGDPDPHGHLRALNAVGQGRDARGALAVGFTATLSRGDGAALGDVWEKVSNRLDILWMIRHGFLLDVRGKRVEVDGLDLDAVKRRNGDYADGALGEALTASLAPEATAKAYLEHASDRPGVLFAPTVESAFAFGAALQDAGIKAETVHGAMPGEERRAIFERAHSGATQVVTNCMVATEGTDVPRWSCAVIARPTQSQALYVQMVGRVLRVDPTDPTSRERGALVLDVVGVTAKHRLRTIADLTGKSFREELDEDESLTEHDDAEELLEDDWEQSDGAGTLEIEYVNGATRTVEVDLFEASRQQWLQTDAGHWFVTAGESHFIFLAPGERPGTWDVCWTHRGRGDWRRCELHKRAQRDGGYTEHRGVELNYAMPWAEDVAAEYPDFEKFASKERSWRHRYPSPAQRRYAESLGVIVPDTMKSGELGNIMTRLIASERIDGIVKAMGRA